MNRPIKPHIAELTRKFTGTPGHVLKVGHTKGAPPSCRYLPAQLPKDVVWDRTCTIGKGPRVPSHRNQGGRASPTGETPAPFRWTPTGEKAAAEGGVRDAPPLPDIPENGD